MKVVIGFEGVYVRVDLDPAALAVIRRAVAARKKATQRNRERTVAAYLRAHPEATANGVHRALGGNRKATLAAVRTVRGAGTAANSAPPSGAPGTRFPEPGNHHDGEDTR